MSKKTDLACDVCVIGGGLAGQLAVLALAKAGLEVILCAPKADQPDLRTTALLADSVTYLTELGVWHTVADKAYPLKTMRIVDGTNRLMRIPQTDFRSSEIGIEAFGYNVQNAELSEALVRLIGSFENIRWIESMVHSIEASGTGIYLVTDNGQNIESGFIVGADGRNSIVRNTLGVGEREWSYPQTAIVLDFDHEHSSRFASTEFHTETGPFTVVPRGDRHAGLVWMETPARAEELTELTKEQLAMVLERQMQSYLGKIEIAGPVNAFELKGLVAKRFGQGNWALIGEAAHVFPPIGAQGFNLGVRDIQSLVDILGRFTNTDDRGGQYDRQRRVDVETRVLGVDVLNRSLLSDFLPVQLLRGAGLQLLSSWPALRKSVMRMGISPRFHTHRADL